MVLDGEIEFFRCEGKFFDGFLEGFVSFFIRGKDFCGIF
jgi:hypothetical protein